MKIWERKNKEIKKYKKISYELKDRATILDWLCRVVKYVDRKIESNEMYAEWYVIKEDVLEIIKLLKDMWEMENEEWKEME